MPSESVSFCSRCMEPNKTNNPGYVDTIDNSGDHDECMKELDDAGIYLILV